MDKVFKRSVTLIELLVTIALIGLLIVGITTLNNFARFHLLSSTRKALLQNELVFVLEDMSKNIIRATGDFNNQGILDLAPVSTGFSVRVDNNTPPTPDDYSDDITISYTLSAVTNKILKDGVSLNTRATIIPGGFVYSSPPLDNGTGIEIALTGRYNPSQAASLGNPEKTMMTKVYSRSATSN